MQSDKAALEEASDSHLVPAVVVGVSDHEAGKDEEEIYGKVAVWERGLGVELEDMVDNHYQGRDSAQAVKDEIMGF